jgi:AcrR family transcriptional regulator
MLSPRLIADAALALVDSDGLEALTTRRLGRRLGCRGMSLYHYFPSKGQLLDAVAARLLAELRVPGPEAGEFLQRFRKLAVDYLALARRHPHAFPLLVLRGLHQPERLGFVEDYLELAAAGGLSPRDAAWAWRAVSFYVNGAGMAWIALQRPAPAAAPARTERAAPVADASRLARAAGWLGPAHFDAFFEDGLDALVASVAGRALAPAAALPASRPRAEARRRG